MTRVAYLAPLLALLLLAGCPDPFIHDPVVVDVNTMAAVNRAGRGPLPVPPSEAPAEYYRQNARFYIVIDEPDYIYKDSWKGFGDYWPLLYKGLNPLPHAIAAYRISKYDQYKRYRHYYGCNTGDKLRKPTLKRVLPPILYGKEEEGGKK